jgi:hypothetical protein
VELVEMRDRILAARPSGTLRIFGDWFARPHDRYSQEHWVDGDRVRALSSVEWYQPSFAPSLSFPAVELDRSVGFR